MDDEIEWTPVKVHLGDLSHWADNPVTLSKSQAKKLLRSKEKLGKMQTLAIGPSNGDGKFPLYDGHQRANVWGAAFGMGLEVWALQSSRPLTDDERHAVPIMLRTAAGSLDWDALAGWTDWPLGEWGLDEDALQGLKFDIAALGNLLESETPETADAEPQIDRAEELNEKWQVKTGDLWRIGEHRLLCGDSTRREDVERVMQGEKALVFSDAPYGVDIVQDNKVGGGNLAAVGNYAPIVGDKTTETAERFYKTCLEFGFVDFILWGGNYFTSFLPPSSCWIVWDKRGDMNSNNFADCELAWTSFEKPARVYKQVWAGMIREGEHEKRFHPTQKPVRTTQEIMRDFPTTMYFDGFVGSGTTIVACQNLGRKCRAIEISPAYCAVTLERMATAFPGIEIERIA